MSTTPPTSSKTRSSGRTRTDGAPRKRPSGKTRRSPSGGDASNWSRHGTALPGWTDLDPPTNRRQPDSSDDSFLEHVSTVRFALVVLLLGGVFTLYVGHVHATKDLANEVQELRSENQRLHLKRNRLQGEFDHKTSPAVIYERARELGLQASVTYGPPVRFE